MLCPYISIEHKIFTKQEIWCVMLFVSNRTQLMLFVVVILGSVLLTQNNLGCISFLQI